MDEINPFPDYPVVGLKAEMGQVMHATIVTPAIAQSRARIQKQVDQWLAHKSKPDAPIESLLCTVEGDYGTGKTHLLLDAAAQFQQGLSSAYPDLTIIRAACVESEPAGWFRSNVGPELRQQRGYAGGATQSSLVERIMIRLYATAGRLVAANIKLTEGAVELLDSDPDKVRDLVNRNLLNITAVDGELSRLLHACCKGVSEDVLNALTGTVWPDTSGLALQWLAGEVLSSQDCSTLRVSAGQMSAEDAADLLAALGSLHRTLNTPFMLIIDELEHFTRYDASRNSASNITWLKRLLERLAVQQVNMFVSGHRSAWEVQADFLERFKQPFSIKLVRLSAEEALKIVQARVPTLNEKMFGLNEADAVVRSTGGTIRRVLSLCSLLFRETKGFKEYRSTEQIENIGRRQLQRTTIEDALPRIQGMLESNGLTARSQRRADGGIPFDLVGDQNGYQRVVVKVAHAIHQTDLYDQVKSFLDKAAEASRIASDIVAIFVADGNVDEKLLGLLEQTKPFKFLWYDLTGPEALSNLDTDLKTVLATDVIPAAVLSDPVARDLVERKGAVEQLESQIELRSATATADQAQDLREERTLIEKQLFNLGQQLTERESDLRRDLLASMMAQISELDSKRTAELRELYKRLEEQQQSAKTRRDEEIVRRQEDEQSPKFHMTYTELNRTPPWSWRLSTALSGSTLIAVLACALLAVSLLLSRGVVTEHFFDNSIEYKNIMSQSDVPLDVRQKWLDAQEAKEVTWFAVWFYGGSLLLFSGAALATIFGIQRVDKFLAFKSRTLRDIYIRSDSVEALTMADKILSDSLDDGGLYGWRALAERRLRGFGILSDWEPDSKASAYISGRTRY